MLKKEATSHLEYHFSLGKFRRHDPKGLVSKHYDLVFVTWTYNHEKWEDKLFFQDYSDWDEITRKKKNPQIS
jgi:hypothetical protein